MLKVEQLKSIATLLKINPATLEAAVASDKETEIELPKDVKLLSDKDLESRDKNVKSTGYNEGVKAGQEIMIKDLKQAHGLTFEGKDSNKFVEALVAKTLSDAKLQPNEQLKEKDNIIANLQKSVQALTAEKEQIQKQHKETLLNDNLIKHVPTLAVGLEPDEVILSMKSKGYMFEIDDAGALVTKHNGQVVRDATTQNAVEVKDVISGYVKERKWEKTEAEQPRGRGAGNSAPRLDGSITTLSQAKKAWEAEGKSANSSEFVGYVQSLSKDNSNFDMNK
ncbi:MAG: hypothetical protein EPN37_07170 [Chitinophagaceae bacterium]|nr:MAG: hypothetical protein EPN37_07170 [Chitinophagaceae bacterium]